MKNMSDAQYKVLLRAAKREFGNVCPTPGLRAATQNTVLLVLLKHGWIEGEIVPQITEAGRKALAIEAERRDESKPKRLV